MSSVLSEYDRFDDATRVWTVPVRLLNVCGLADPLTVHLHLDAPGKLLEPISLQTLNKPGASTLVLMFTSCSPIDGTQLILLIDGTQRARPQLTSKGQKEGPDGPEYWVAYAASQELLAVIAAATSIELRIGSAEYVMPANSGDTFSRFLDHISAGVTRELQRAREESTIAYVRDRAAKAAGKVELQGDTDQLIWYRKRSRGRGRSYASIIGRPQPFEWHCEITLSNDGAEIDYYLGTDLLATEEVSGRPHLGAVQRRAAIGLREIQSRSGYVDARPTTSRIEELESKVGPLPLDSYVRLRDRGQL